MSQHEAFLQSILEAPNDDAPRLVYADWLDDHGDGDRAEFIRVQCRLARLDPYDPERRELRRREYELHAEHWGEWAAPFVGRVERWRFRRGFVEQIRCDGRQFLKEAKRLLELAPIRELLLEHPEKGDFRRVVASKHLRRITHLDLDFARLGDDGMAGLADSSNVAQLTDLSLKWNDLTTAGMLAVVRTPRLRSLRRVQFYESDGWGKDDDFQAVVKGCTLPALQRLHWNSKLSPDSIRALLDAPLARQLTSLSLQRIGPEGLRLLAGSAALERLEWLEAQYGEDVDAEAAARLAGSPLMGRLTSLTLSLLKLGDDGVIELSRAPAGRLRELDLSCNQIGEAGARALAGAPLCRSLARLDLASNCFGDRGAAALAKSANLGSLRHLDVGSSDVTWRGARALLGSPLADQLSLLGLGGNEIGTKAFGALRARMGERLEHDDYDEVKLTGPEIICRVKAQPPRCVRGLNATPDTPLLRRFPRQRGYASEMATVAFELTSPDPTQRVVLLGYPEERNLFLSPYAIRWEPSGRQREFFDAEQHGLNAEYGRNCTMTGAGRRVPWTCGQPRCREHRFVVSFHYRIEYPPRVHHDRYLPLADQFYHFDLDAYCPSQDRMVSIASFERK